MGRASFPQTLSNFSAASRTTRSVGARATRAGRQRNRTQSIVDATIELRGRGTGRIWLGVVKDVCAASLGRFVKEAAEPGNTLLTDGRHGHTPQHKAYDPIEPRLSPARKRSLCGFD